jgi:hypothetical protein
MLTIGRACIKVAVATIARTILLPVRACHFNARTGVQTSAHAPRAERGLNMAEENKVAEGLLRLIEENERLRARVAQVRGVEDPLPATEDTNELLEMIRGYIRDLERKVRDSADVERQNNLLQEENRILRAILDVLRPSA